MTRRLFYACGAILMLALAFALGASGVKAQGTADPVVGIASDGSQGAYLVVTAQGSVFRTTSAGSEWAQVGGVTPTTPASLGQLKARWR